MSLNETAFAGRQTVITEQREHGDESETSGPRMRALQEALRTQQEALLVSMQNTIDVIRDGAVYRTSDLASAHQVVEDCLRELRADPTELPEVRDEQIRRFLVNHQVRRELVLRNRAIEDWLAEWQAAEQSQTTP